MARKKSSGRNIHGVLLLDKRSGVTSNRALQEVKRLFNARKAGHTGSLDPLATGLLPVCFGAATKFSSYLLNDDKCYRVEIELGHMTSTGDREGEIISTHNIPPLDEKCIGAALQKFVGSTEQIPPMYSALKHQGVRLYDLARQGIVVKREPRQITIHQLILESYNDNSIELTVTCSKGTYVRTLAEDIGKSLGSGGFVKNLRRTQVGELNIGNAVTIEHLQNIGHYKARLACLLTTDQALPPWPSVHLSPESTVFVRQGQAVVSSQAPRQGWVKLFLQNGDFFGLGEIQADGKIAPRRLY